MKERYGLADVTAKSIPIFMRCLKGKTGSEYKSFHETEYAALLQCEVKVANATFIVNSYFPKQANDDVVSKVERLIKDEVKMMLQTN